MPTVRYVNCLLVWLVAQDDHDETLTLLPDMSLPVVSDFSEKMLRDHGDTFDYQNVVNRLKVMCNLNPWRCNTEQVGIVKLRIPCTLLSRITDRKTIDVDMRVRIQPRDAAVQIEIARISGHV